MKEKDDVLEIKNSNFLGRKMGAPHVKGTLWEGRKGKLWEGMEKLCERK